MCFVRIREGFLFLLVCLLVCLLDFLFLLAVTPSKRAFKFGHNHPLAVSKKWFFHMEFFQGQKVNFRNFQGHFFQNRDWWLKFWHNTGPIELIKSCFEFFRNFNFFKAERSIFERLIRHGIYFKSFPLKMSIHFFDWKNSWMEYKIQISRGNVMIEN